MKASKLASKKHLFARQTVRMLDLLSVAQGVHVTLVVVPGWGGVLFVTGDRP